MKFTIYVLFYFMKKYLSIIFISLLVFACGESTDANSDGDRSNEITSEY